MTTKELNFLDCLVRNGFDNSNVTIVVKDTVLHDVFEQEVRDERKIAKAGIYVWNEKVCNLVNCEWEEIQPNDSFVDVYNNTIYYYSFD